MPHHGTRYELNGQVGDWATWASRGPAASVAVLHRARYDTVLVDPLLVDRDDTGLIAELVQRYDAEVVLEAPLPEPAEMGPRQDVDPGALNHVSRDAKCEDMHVRPDDSIGSML